MDDDNATMEVKTPWGDYKMVVHPSTKIVTFSGPFNQHINGVGYTGMLISFRRLVQNGEVSWELNTFGLTRPGWKDATESAKAKAQSWTKGWFRNYLQKSDVVNKWVDSVVADAEREVQAERRKILAAWLDYLEVRSEQINALVLKSLRGEDVGLAEFNEATKDIYRYIVNKT